MVAIHLHQPRSRARRHDEIRFWRDAGRRVVATLGEWRRRARDRAELAALDERTLADIGLSRADAEFLANKPFWREWMKRSLTFVADAIRKRVRRAILSLAEPPARPDRVPTEYYRFPPF